MICIKDNIPSSQFWLRDYYLSVVIDWQITIFLIIDREEICGHLLKYFLVLATGSE